MLRCPNCGAAAEHGEYPMGVRQRLEPADPPGGVPIKLDAWWCWSCLKSKTREAWEETATFKGQNLNATKGS